MPSEQLDKLEILRRYRRDLEQHAEEARRARDDQGLAVIKLLLQQCDFLVERAERESEHLL